MIEEDFRKWYVTMSFARKYLPLFSDLTPRQRGKAWSAYKAYNKAAASLIYRWVQA